MAFERLAGIILHPTSLPGGYGIGDLGTSAYEFSDFLYRSGVGLWQILPLGPVGDSASPYQSPSALAGNPMLIDLDALEAEHLLSKSDLEQAPANTSRVDFPVVVAFKDKMLTIAYENYKLGKCSALFSKSYEEFCYAEKDWLRDYALFAALKNYHKQAAWFEWDEDISSANPAAKATWENKLAADIGKQAFAQFCFFTQWEKLRLYAAEQGVKFVGDLPIYCALDSVDVWANRKEFDLDKDGKPIEVSGVPPDYFSETGQLWGNPLYRWDDMKKEGYPWWLNRIRSALRLMDIIRIDHFRGLESFWSVPATETTAINGKWLPGPGQSFFDAVQKEFGGLPIIAEDLGIITKEVDKLRTDNELPGMKILQFAFCYGAEHYLPHTYDPNTVCYTATHDNDTTRGWYDAQGPDYDHMDRGTIEWERDRCRKYLGRDGSGISWDMMRLAFGSVANTAVVPMQDVLSLGNDARMNKPGIGEGQWSWRLSKEQLTWAPVEYLRDMLSIFGRLPEIPEQEKPEEVEAEILKSTSPLSKEEKG